jgi:Na+-driven multidrug efflux pump
MHIVIWSMLFFGGAGVFSGIMRASGTVIAPMVMTIIAIVAVELPVGVFLNQRIGVDGIWWAYPAAFCTMFAMQGTYYALVWRKKRVERLI